MGLQKKRTVFFAMLIALSISLAVLPVSHASIYNELEEGGVIYPANKTVKRIKEYRESAAPDGARKVKFTPMGNNPLVDPMNKAYQNWVTRYRGDRVDIASVDESYEEFVQEASPLLFSMGFKRLDPDVRDMISAIPPDALEPLGRRFEPQGPIGIERAADPFDPFEGSRPAEEEILGRDVELSISMRDQKPTEDRLINMAYDALQLGQFESAISLYGELVSRQPENKEAMFGLASAQHRNNQIDDARQTYLDLLAQDPDYWPALNNVMVLAGEQSPQDALRELQRLELINPEFSPIAAQIGVIYLRLNQLDNAIKYLTRATLISPENLAYRYNLAVVLDHGGYKRQAFRMYKQLLEAADKGYQLPESRDKIIDRITYIATLRHVAR